MYQVTKTYGHDRGISCAFRQHKAKSHCNQIHGYALSFSFVFESEGLNENNWVIDFGDLKELEKALRMHFDHKLIVATDDPCKQEICDLRMLNGGNGIADLNFMPAVGCEAFARHAYNLALPIITRLNSNSVDKKFSNYIKIKSVTVAEHGSNSATYTP